MKHTHAKERKTAKDFFRRLYLSYIPNGKDNIKQIIIKVFFLISLITLIVFRLIPCELLFICKKAG